MHTHLEPASPKTYLYTEDGVDHYANTEDEARYALVFQRFQCYDYRCKDCERKAGFTHITRNMDCTRIPRYRIDRFLQCDHPGTQCVMLFWNCDKCKVSVGVQHVPSYDDAYDGI